MPKATKPVRRSAADRGGYLREDGRRARRREQERRAARVHRDRVWVREHVSEGHIVRGHWRDNPEHHRTSTVLREDYADHVRQVISEHARAVQAGAVDRAAALKAELQAYARMLTE
jgi:hypothetical protein